MKVLESLAERQSVFHQQLLTAAETINSLTTQLTRLLQVMKKMQGELDVVAPKKLELSKMSPEDDLGNEPT